MSQHVVAPGPACAGWQGRKASGVTVNANAPTFPKSLLRELHANSLILCPCFELQMFLAAIGHLRIKAGFKTAMNQSATSLTVP